MLVNDQRYWVAEWAGAMPIVEEEAPLKGGPPTLAGLGVPLVSSGYLSSPRMAPPHAVQSLFA
jgi:hypothetical protein